MDFVKDSGYFHTLNRHLKVALWLDLLSVSLSFIIPLMKCVNDGITCIQWYNIAVVFILGYTLFANVRFTVIFINLLTDPMKGK